MGGNQFMVKPQFGAFDGLRGLVLKGSSTGYKKANVQLLNIRGQIRDIEVLTQNGSTSIVFARNNDTAIIYEVSEF